MTTSAGRLDDRDLAVLDELDAGQVVTPDALERRYRRHTDVRRPRTLRRRVEALLAHAAFRKVAFREWRFEGLE